jgi:tetratricopeptide (TPR) repeat protein
MNHNFTKTLLISFAILIAGFVGIWKLSDVLTKNRPQLSSSIEDADLTFKSEKLAKYNIGFNGLIADWYWISALQYLGKKAVANKGNYSYNDLKPLKPKQLYPLLDTATTLDPKFVNVYSYGAIILPSFDEEKAIKLAEKGIANNPNEWRLFQHLAYIYWQKGDFKKAAEIYAKGSEVEGSPPFMKQMSARLEAEGGSRDVARQIYQQMYDEATDDQTKSLAAARLLQTESFEERDAIRQVLKDYQTKNNRCPANWSEVFPQLRQIKLPPINRPLRLAQNGSPIDPTDGVYLLNSTTCDVELDFKTTKILRN